MEFAPFHHRVLIAGLPVFERFGLILAGGYAMRAHGFVDRPSKDLDFATDSRVPLPEIAAAVAEAYRRLGFELEINEVTPRMGRLVVADPGTGEWCELDLLKEALQGRPFVHPTCRVVSMDDAIGMKVRALAGRGLARDFIDVEAVSGYHSFRELERLGAIHDEEFSHDALLLRLGAAEWIGDHEFASYGLAPDDIRRIRRFAIAWVTEIAERRAEDGDTPQPSPRWPDPDSY